MRNLIWIGWFLVAILVAAISVAFVYHNRQVVDLELLLFPLPSQILGTVLVAVFIFGIIWGVILGAMPFFGYKLREKKLIKERDQAKQELDRLRTAAIKESQ